MQAISDPSRIASLQVVPRSYDVFSKLELAAMISSYCASSDRVTLLQTCRSLFNASIPFVWCYVDGVQNLLLLIAGASYDEEALRLELPASLKKNTFDRFDIYSPYVKVLDVYPTPAFRLSGWGLLFSRTNQQPLLSNLRTLIIGNCGLSNNLDLPTWVAVFASASLTSFSTMQAWADEPFAISYSLSCSVLKLLTTKCPNLTEVVLSPDSTHNSSTEENYPILKYMFPEHPNTYLSGLSKLEIFGGSIDWLINDSLDILGQLPALTILSIYSSTDWTISFGSITSVNPFPSLRSVLLYKLSNSDLLSFMRITALTKNLISLDVQSELGTQVANEDVTDTSLMQDFFPLLINMPNLAKLSIDPDLEDDWNGFVLTVAELEILRQLPLQTLHLSHISIDRAALDIDFAQIFPFVTDVYLPHHPAGPYAISRFAMMPQLYYLHLRLNFSTNTLLETWQGSSNSPMWALVAAPKSVIPSNFKGIDRAIDILFDIFPNLMRVDWSQRGLKLSNRDPLEEWIEVFDGHLAARVEILALRRALYAKLS